MKRPPVSRSRPAKCLIITSGASKRHRQRFSLCCWLLIVRRARECASLNQRALQPIRVGCGVDQRARRMRQPHPAHRHHQHERAFIDHSKRQAGARRKARARFRRKSSRNKLRPMAAGSGTCAPKVRLPGRESKDCSTQATPKRSRFSSVLSRVCRR